MKTPEQEGRDQKPLPGWLNGLIIGGAFITLVILELHRPLRRGKTEPKLRRTIRNLAVAGLSAFSLQLTERPMTARLTRSVVRDRLGLLQQCRLPDWLDTTLGVVLLDYTLYLWHVLTHKVPFLWRFHKVHHVDLDMDASTAIRFHFGEMLISVLYRAVQVRLLGISPAALALWNIGLLVEIMFHHSNVELPPSVERWLRLFVVTPRMHGIHHSIVPEEMNSNWSSGLTVWDWLHGTFRWDTPQAEITIGTADLRDPHEVTLLRILALPFHGHIDSIEEAYSNRFTPSDNA